MHYETFRFTSAELPTGPVRTYAILGVPEGPGPHPAILHIHGGGQTASPEAVEEQAVRGYACLSFDWTGGPHAERSDEVITHYPPDEARHVPVVRAERAYLGAGAALKCLERLAADPRVDADRIGIYGISWGGFITWKVAASSPLVRCAVPIYGTGGLMRPGHLWDHDWETLSAPEQQAWLAHMEPMTFAPRIRCPILHLNGSNDFFGAPDVFADLAAVLPGPVRVDYSPNSNHHVSCSGVRLMERFFDHHLRGGSPPPSPPTLSLQAVEGTTIRVSARGSGGALRLWHSPEHPRYATRCWQAVEGPARTAREQAFTVTGCGDTWLYLKERFADGMGQCSVPLRVLAVAGEAAPRGVLFDGQSPDGAGVLMSTEIRMAGDVEELYAMGPDGLSPRRSAGAIEGLYIRTPALPEAQAPAGADLLIDVRGAARLTVQAGWLANSPDAAEFTCTLEPPEDGPQALRPERFTRPEDAPLQDFTRVEYLTVTAVPRAGESVALRHCRWHKLAEARC